MDLQFLKNTYPLKLGLPIVWNFLRDEWSYLVERFSLNDRYLGRMPKYIGSTFASQFRLNEMKDFFKKYPDAGAGTIIIFESITIL